MQIKLQHIVILALLVTLAASNVYAQEAGFPDFEYTDPEREKLERERVINSPGEGETRYTVRPTNPASGSNAKDSVTTTTIITPTVKPAPAPPAGKTHQSVKPADKQSQARGQDESILSFNFLYYIIEKYKLQDIID